jgi:hypothetical protein
MNRMKKLKHNKLRNTGVLFELLVRQVASDTLNNMESKALPIIKEFFSKSTDLSKELQLYQALLKEKFKNESRTENFLNAVLSARKKLNESSLNKQKYSLIKEIKNHYPLEQFFTSRVNNYKMLASIYKIFEYAEADNPVDFTNAKYTLAEHVLSKPATKTIVSENTQALSQQNEDVRLLTYKILVDKYNEKYDNLNVRQKTLLREYINNVSNSTTLKGYIDAQIPQLQKQIKELSSGISDKVIKIKLNEITNLITNISKAKVVKDSHILAMLRYYELVKELKKLGTK